MNAIPPKVPPIEPDAFPSNEAPKAETKAAIPSIFARFQVLCEENTPPKFPCGPLANGAEVGYAFLSGAATELKTHYDAAIESEEAQWAYSVGASWVQSAKEQISATYEAMSHKDFLTNAQETGSGLARGGVRVGKTAASLAGQGLSAAKYVWDGAGLLGGTGLQVLLAVGVIIVASNTFKRTVVVAPPQNVYLPPALCKQQCQCGMMHHPNVLPPIDPKRVSAQTA